MLSHHATRASIVLPMNASIGFFLDVPARRCKRGFFARTHRFQHLSGQGVRVIFVPVDVASFPGRRVLCVCVCVCGGGWHAKGVYRVGILLSVGTSDFRRQGMLALFGVVHTNIRPRAILIVDLDIVPAQADTKGGAPPPPPLRPTPRARRLPRRPPPPPPPHTVGR